MCKRVNAAMIGCGCCLVMLVGSLSFAEDCSQWRGPRRDGHMGGFISPKAWPEKLTRQWKVEVGEGHASPIVVGDRVFVFSRQGEEEVVRAVSPADGRELWRQSYPAPYKVNPAARSHGKGPKSTPIVFDGRLFTLGISGILSCWDTDSGKRLWQHEFSKQFKQTSPLYGTSMSPVVVGGLLIAHVGGHDQGALTAFDLATGRVSWQCGGDGPAYTSPIVATLGDTRQLITESRNARIGVSPADGSLLWTLPFRTDYDMNVVTPVLADDLVVFSGYRKGITACRLDKSQGKWSTEEVWHNGDLAMFMSSPVVVGDHLFGLSQFKKGQFFCLDVPTGKLVWTSDGRMGENAAIVNAGGVLLALTTNGELIVFTPNTERFQPLARYKVADTPTWAHPVVMGSRILIKDKSSLALWAIKEPSAVEPLWRDDFNSYEPRWNWQYSAGTGFRIIEDGILEAGVTDQSNRQVYSDCSLHEANLSWEEGIVEMRLRYCAEDVKAGSMGWGFWTAKPWPMEVVTAAWFVSVSPPSDPELVGFRAMVIRNGVYLLSQPISVSLDKWHVYRVEMTSTGTRFFIDGEQVASCQESPGGKHRAEVWVDNLCVRKEEGRLQRSQLDVPEEQRVYVDWVRFCKVPGKEL